MGREESSQERLTVDLSGRAPAIRLGGPDADESIGVPASYLAGLIESA
jgi:hypothetical protein